MFVSEFYRGMYYVDHAGLVVYFEKAEPIFIGEEAILGLSFNSEVTGALKEKILIRQFLEDCQNNDYDVINFDSTTEEAFLHAINS